MAAVTMTLREMMRALAVADPNEGGPRLSGEDDVDLETSLTFERLPKRESIEGGTLPAGLYCWFAEYPDEGCFPLFDLEEEPS